MWFVLCGKYFSQLLLESLSISSIKCPVRFISPSPRTYFSSPEHIVLMVSYCFFLILQQWNFTNNFQHDTSQIQANIDQALIFENRMGLDSGSVSPVSSKTIFLQLNLYLCNLYKISPTLKHHF